MTLEERFARLGIDNAPGQESLQKSVELELRGEKIDGEPVDFSHEMCIRDRWRTDE